MIPRRCIFDDQGNFWPIARSDFRLSYASHMPVEQFHDFAIINLGFVSWEEGEGWTHIRLRKSKVSPVALTSLLYRLTDHPIGRTALSVFDTEWSHEIFADRGALLTRLEQHAVDVFDEDTRRFLSEAVDLDGLASDDPQVLLYRYWKTQRFEPHNMAALCGELFSGRFTIARVQPSTEMVIEHIGNGYKVYNEKYVEHARGTRHQDEPDTVYGQWVTRTHKQVLDTGKPLLEDVDAMIGASRSIRRRACYRRIVLPFTCPLGDPYLVTASTNHPVNLRQRIA
ncbi:MAG: hypothetical protein ACI9DC_005161 [Gammaproteobacteria bacterium]|jgi:hypothetical protein